ncbi:hypothetical protein ILUMI_19726 [Ignelater luminosus]|uniref:Uncharacterized protein n=1 Tax=Ignelater luminosus TaxID=2038154 RepID=A0A8K0CIQ9_IGNLU|nr:hypothetical protein ILUMI_19726 [Ignelater luminosus]
MGDYEETDVGSIYDRRRQQKRGGGKKRKRSKKRRRSNVSTSYSKLSKPSRDPFVQFLRSFRQRHIDRTIRKVAVEGSRTWCSRTKPQRRKYLLDAFQETPRPPRRNDRIVKQRRRKRSKSGHKKSKKGGTLMDYLDVNKNYNKDFGEYYYKKNFHIKYFELFYVL